MKTKKPELYSAESISFCSLLMTNIRMNKIANTHCGKIKITNISVLKKIK